MKVCVVGLGYIGFPTACVVSDAGHDVLGVDTNSELIRRLNSGELHIRNEHGLRELSQKVFASGRLRVSECLEPADVFIVAVPTPRKMLSKPHNTHHDVYHTGEGYENCCKDTGQLSKEQSASDEDLHCVHCSFGADLRHVEQATYEIARYVRPGNLVILESTVPPGTTKSVVGRVLEQETGFACGQDIFLAHAPERVLPGRILEELRQNVRVVGGTDDASTEHAISFYRTFVLGDVIGTDATTAELVKLMENAFRDVNIALANEFALICEEIGVNVFEAIALANHHPRVNILTPGPGVGGHCIPIDPYFIIEAVPDKTRLLTLARQINNEMPLHVVSLANQIREKALRSGTSLRKVLALGASYKANVGDERESPALEIASMLVCEDYDVIVHDPYIERFSERDIDSLLQDCDLIVMLTDHDFYRDRLEPRKVFQRMRNHFILDTRGFFGSEWDEAGFHVVRLGVGK